ncbi:MAG: hypothetical protein ACOYUZ_04615 [Patescibacteria group bacterium]
MKITLCGSIAFFEEMQKVQQELEFMGHEVKIPPTHIEDESGKMIPVADYYNRRKSAGDDEIWVWERKSEAMKNHFEKVEWADAILVLNYDKKGIAGYIGANTLLEMGLAFHLAKPIYLLRQIPEIDFKEEVLGMKPVIVDNVLKFIPLSVDK